jgi:hypothetical protein
METRRMNKTSAVSLVFWVAAAYDGVLGVLFLLSPSWAFERFAVTPPNHFGYVQFPALLLVVFAIMLVQVARDPAGRRDLMPYGMALKVSYCSVVFYYWATTGLPDMWKPFAWADLAFLAAFAWAYQATRRPEVASTGAGAAD